MQNIIRSSSNRVTQQRNTSEAARSRKFAQNIGLVVFIVFLMAMFVLTNLLMLESFKEQPAFGFQREERQALGVGPLLRDMLRRRGFHRVPHWKKKEGSIMPLGNASAPEPANVTSLLAQDEAQESLAEKEVIEQDPPKEADLDEEEAASEQAGAEERLAEVLDPEEAGVAPEVLAAAGGDVDLAVAAEAEALAEDAASGVVEDVQPANAAAGTAPAAQPALRGAKPQEQA